MLIILYTKEIFYSGCCSREWKGWSSSLCQRTLTCSLATACIFAYLLHAYAISALGQYFRYLTRSQVGTCLIFCMTFMQENPSLWLAYTLSKSYNGKCVEVRGWNWWHITYSCKEKDVQKVQISLCLYLSKLLLFL